MRDAVAALLAQHGLAPSAKVLVAVSGGVDSVVLAHVLRALGFDISMAHMNYGLRGADSDADQAFVESLGAAWDVPVHVKQVELESGANIQLAARSARYVWFEELQTAHEYTWVATGHHAHDHLETVLFRLMRGTGNAGLVGIPVVRDRIVRPLRNTPKPLLLDYAKQHKLAWREDASNASDAYTRNRIRHHVVPILEARDPEVVQRMLATSEQALEQERAVQALADAWESELVVLPAEELWSRNPLLWELLKRRGFTSGQSDQVVGLRAADSGKAVRSATHVAVQHGGVVHLLAAPKAAPASISIPDLAALQRVFDVQMFAADEVPKVFFERNAFFVADPNALEFPLVLRRWEEGDRIAPLGMQGTKLLSDVFGQAKVPVYARGHVPVLAGPQGVLWIAGHARSRHALLEADTSKALVVSLRPMV